MGDDAQPSDAVAALPALAPAALAAPSQLSAAESAALGMARGAASLADHVLFSSDPVQDLGRTMDRAQGRVHAFALRREACLWVLGAMASRPDHEDMKAALESAPRPRLAAAAGGEDALARIEASLLGGVARFAALETAAQRRALDELQRFVRALVTSLEPVDSIFLARRRRRRLGFAAAATVLVLAFVGLVVAPPLRHPDLAKTASWETSSAVSNTAQKGHEQKLIRRLGMLFFHTKEEDKPWIVFELEAPRTISRVDVRNRSDCCAERALPLVVETSTDGKIYEEVARNTEMFVEWSATFEPRSASHVRLRAGKKKTSLHLEQVEIH